MQFAGGLGYDDHWADQGVGDGNAFERHTLDEIAQIERVIVEHADMIPAILDHLTGQSGYGGHQVQIARSNASQIVCGGYGVHWDPHYSLQGIIRGIYVREFLAKFAGCAVLLDVREVFETGAISS